MGPRRGLEVRFVDVMTDAFKSVSDAMSELVESFYPQAIVGNTTVGFTVYTLWLLIALTLCVIAVFAYKRQVSADLVPHGVFANGIEYIVDFVRNDVCKGTLGHTWRKHFPFLATVFFFVMFGNYIGMLPTWKAGTGSTGITGAVAVMSFCYFVYVGVSSKGVGGYIKSLAPSGLPVWVTPLVWVIEVFSTFLRIITLAVRLFCNMFAGHVVMGVFAIMVTTFVQPLLNGVVNGATIGTGAMSLLWMLLLILIYGVELMIAFIQAYIFTLLSAVYVQLAESEAH